MKKFAIVLAVMLGIFCLNGIVFADVIVQNTVPKERTTFSEYETALEHYNKGEYQKSISILKDYIKQTPDPWGYWLMGYSLYKLKRFDEANQYFKNAFLVDPSFSPTPTLEKQLKHPYEPARPEGYPKGMAPAATPAPIPKLQQGTKVITEPAPAEEQPMEEVPMAPEPAEPVPAPAAPVPSPATAEQPSAAVPPPGETQVPAPAAPQAAQPEAPQEAAPPPPPPPAPKPAPKPVQPGAKPFPTEPMPGDIIAIITAMMATILLFLVIGSVIIGIFIFLLARKLGVRFPVLGFVPVIQFWTLAACAGMSTLMTILLFLLEIVFFPLASAIIFLKVAEQLGKSKAIGLILGFFIPIIPLIWFAFAAGGGGTSMAGGMGDMPDLSREPDIPDLDFDLEEEEPAPRAKSAAAPAEEEDDWHLPGEETEAEQNVDDWQLPQDDEEHQ